MPQPLSALLVVSAASGFLVACAEESVLDRPPGTYRQESRFTDSSGTTTERKASTEVEIDDYGRKKATVESETTRDPEGLFNKTTTHESRRIVEED